MIVQEGVAVDDPASELWTVRPRSSSAARAAGAATAARPAAVELPDRAPDARPTYDVTPQQALLYRLCGDRNPLHADPEFARAAGFPAPILHGLCTYGIVLREVTDALLDGDASRVARVRRAVRRGRVPGRDDPRRRLGGRRADRRQATVGDGPAPGTRGLRPHHG